MALFLSLCIAYVPTASKAETPEEVRQRLDLYRRSDAERAEQVRKTREWQRQRAAAEAQAREARAREEYLHTWKAYGTDEVNVKTWKQEKDGTWVADAKFNSVKADPGEHRSNAQSLSEIFVPTRSDRSWVRVRVFVSNQELASRLLISSEELARINDVTEEHLYKPDDYLIVPSQKIRAAKQLAYLDTSDIRRTPPVQSSVAAEETATVRFGDTVFKIAQRYGLTLSELLRLNPGMETARLVVGSPIRLSQSAPVRPRMVLGLRPSSSGGISWPDLPDYGKNQKVQEVLYSLDRVAVNCTSLMINRALAYSAWGEWRRPVAGSADESIIVDRCAKNP